MCLFKFLTTALPVCVHASVRGEVKRTEDSKRRRSAVSQCWMSKELMEAGGKTLGRMEPCTIQASFIRSAGAGAKHPKRSAAHLMSTPGDWICIGGCSNQTQACGTHAKVAINTVLRSTSQNETHKKLKQARSCYKIYPFYHHTQSYICNNTVVSGW